VVLDQTALAYTGKTKLPKGKKANLSALVTNPDDAGTPPVADVPVTFLMEGAGGTLTRTAITSPDGIASVNPIMTLPAGDYQLTVSTARLGKHAPATVTVPVRVPTATQRIKDLEQAVEGADLPHGVEHSLLKKLERARERLQDGKTGGACNALRAFVNQVRALRGEEIPVVAAQRFIAEAKSIRRQLDCPHDD
jgi:hypothetical protein